MEIVLKDLSYQVVGCAQRVHSALGPGFPEAVYQHALCIELKKQGLHFEAEAAFEVAYDDQLCGRFKVDIWVDRQIIVELKAADSLCGQHEAQTLAYLKASSAHLALLMNFGEERLRVKRFVN